MILTIRLPKAQPSSIHPHPSPSNPTFQSSHLPQALCKGTPASAPNLPPFKVVVKMSSYNKLPGESKASTREELAKCLKDFEKQLRELKKLISDQSNSSKDKTKLVVKIGDNLINLKNRINTLLRTPVPANEKQMIDKLKKTAEELFRQFADAENQISSSARFEPTSDPHDTFDPGFVEEESLAIRDEDELSHENLLKRNEEIQQVHKDFVEVNSMFKEVAHLVDQQGESLDVADGHVDTAVKETTRANIELDSANRYQRSAKKKIVVIFIIVAVVVAILIGVVVATTM